MKVISEKEFQAKCEEFSKIESRASFYDLANEIIEKHPIQACIIILATWNIGNFKFVKDREKLLDELKTAFNNCKPLFEQLKGLKFCEINFEDIKETVKKIFDSFSRIDGVKYTGASKVMHLLNKDLFVMWDSYINGNKPEKYYTELNLNFKKYNANAEGYIDFLKDMQKKYCHINEGFKGRTFAKSIDENNYIAYTKPIQKLEKRDKKEKLNS